MFSIKAILLSLVTCLGPVPATPPPDPLDMPYYGISFLYGCSTEIVTIDKDSPADNLGLRAGDEIVCIGNTAILGYLGLAHTLNSYRPGAIVKIKVKRIEYFFMLKRPITTYLTFKIKPDARNRE